MEWFVYIYSLQPYFGEHTRKCNAICTLGANNNVFNFDSVIPLINRLPNLVQTAVFDAYVYDINKRDSFE